MRKISLLYLFCCLISCTAVLAQDMSVSGTVTSADDGSSLPGVNVQVKGSQRGTQTDATGNYTVEAAPNAVLIFSFVGFTPQEITVGSSSKIDVQLASDTRAIGSTPSST